MAEYNDTWANCIRELLEREGLNVRETAKKVEGLVSHTHISDWRVHGLVPSDPRVAVKFFEYFPNQRDIAIKALEAIGVTIPTDWLYPAESLQITLKDRELTVDEFMKIIRVALVALKKTGKFTENHIETLEKEVRKGLDTAK